MLFVKGLEDLADFLIIGQTNKGILVLNPIVRVNVNLELILTLGLNRQ